MFYVGVARHNFEHPEFEALRRFSKSHESLSDQEKDEVGRNMGLLAVWGAQRDKPEDALKDAVDMCRGMGLNIGYAQIKRDDGMYFTDAETAAKHEYSYNPC